MANRPAVPTRVVDRVLRDLGYERVNKGAAGHPVGYRRREGGVTLSLPTGGGKDTPLPILDVIGAMLARAGAIPEKRIFIRLCRNGGRRK